MHLNDLGLRSVDMQVILPNKKLSVQNETSLLIKDLKFHYIKNTQVLQSVNLDIKKGSIVGIIGDNGAGKSTLLELICGLKKQSSGEIFFCNQKTDAKQRIKNSYYVMQNSDCQLFSESVEKELHLGKKTSESDQLRAHTALEQLSLDSLLERHPASLSGGQKQRLAIALSQTKTAQIICMDEPTSGLDFNNMMKVAQFTRDMAQNGSTILSVSHDYEFLMATCTHICKLEHGKITDYFELNEISYRKLHSLYV